MKKPSLLSGLRSARRRIARLYALERERQGRKGYDTAPFYRGIRTGIISGLKLSHWVLRQECIEFTSSPSSSFIHEKGRL